MESLGFKPMRGDACVWIRGKGDMKVYVYAHVDDLLIGGKPEGVQQLKRDTKYTMVWTVGKQHSSRNNTIGLDITITESHDTSIAERIQRGYPQKILNTHWQEATQIECSLQFNHFPKSEPKRRC
jgi:hypothetical protein